MKRSGDGQAAQQDVAVENVTVKPLGAGQEVGRSCYVVKYQGKGVMFDCGIHPAFSGAASLATAHPGMAQEPPSCAPPASHAQEAQLFVALS